MITLVSTISAEDANSYCDAIYADEYFAAHPDPVKVAAWDALGSDTKDLCLVQACADIETFKFTVDVDDASEVHLRYDNLNHRNYYTVPGLEGQPIKYNSFQALQFPRNKDVRSNGGTYIPERIKMAQCEQALHLATTSFTTQTSINQGIASESFSAAGIEISTDYRDPSKGGGTINNIHPLAMQWISKFIPWSRRIDRS